MNVLLQSYLSLLIGHLDLNSKVVVSADGIKEFSTIAKVSFCD